MMTALMVLAIQIQPSAPDGFPNGSRLEEGRFCYTLEMRRDGASRAVGRTLQVVRHETFEGRPVVRVIVHQQLQDGAFDVRDDFLLEPADLRPVRYVSRRNGEVRVDVAYGTDLITGYHVADSGRREDLSVALAEPVWDGNLWGILFAALPLSEGREITLPFWHYEKGFGQFSVTVVGSETAAGPDGRIEAWIAEATDGQGPKVTYRLGRGRGLELSYAAGALAQTPGGDCTGLPDR